MPAQSRFLRLCYQTQSSRGLVLATFEESLKQLEGIVAQLERGALPLEDSLKMFVEGMRLSAQSNTAVDRAES